MFYIYLEGLYFFKIIRKRRLFANLSGISDIQFFLFDQNYSKGMSLKILPNLVETKRKEIWSFVLEVLNDDILGYCLDERYWKLKAYLTDLTSSIAKSFLSVNNFL